MTLRYDVPDGAFGGQYILRIEFDETRFRFFVADDSDAAAQAEQADDWIDIGEWRDASLWLARQLLALGSPVAFGTIGDEVVGGADDGSHPFAHIGSPAHAARDLTGEEILRLLNEP